MREEGKMTERILSVLSPGFFGGGSSVDEGGGENSFLLLSVSDCFACSLSVPFQCILGRMNQNEQMKQNSRIGYNTNDFDKMTATLRHRMIQTERKGEMNVKPVGCVEVCRSVGYGVWSSGEDTGSSD